MFGWLERSVWVGLFCGWPTIQKCPTKNLRGWQIVTRLSERHGSCISLVIVVRTGNQGLSKRLGASPNRPVWTGVAVEAPKLRRSRVPSWRWIGQPNIVRRAISGPSQPHHSLVLDRVFSTNSPVGQTVQRLAVWTVGAIGGDALTPSGHAFCGVAVSTNCSERFAPLQWSTGTRSHPITRAKFLLPSSMSD